jgi:hypothetical protein
MYHLRLIKGLSYSGAVSATKEHPDVFVEDEKRYQRAMASGYFEEVEIVQEETSGDLKTDFEGTSSGETVDTFENMNLNELKAYASLGGIDISGLNKKEEIIEAIKTAESNASKARDAIRQ